MEKYVDTKMVMSAIVAALVIGALVKYGNKIPVVGATVADAASLAK